MWDWIGKLDELRRQNQLAVLVTVTKSTGSTPRKHGAKMIVLPDGTFFGTVGGGVPEFFALEDARKCLDEMQGATSNIPLQQRGEFPACGGTMELYMEVINNNPTLYLFGAGHIGQSLCQVLDGTPFRIHLIDERDEWINAPAIPGSVIRHHWLRPIIRGTTLDQGLHPLTSSTAAKKPCCSSCGSNHKQRGVPSRTQCSQKSQFDRLHQDQKQLFLKTAGAWEMHPKPLYDVRTLRLVMCP